MVEPNSNRWPGDDGEGHPADPHGGERLHAHYEVLLERHLDGELVPQEREELFAHLENCERCRNVLEAEEALIDQLSRIPRLMPPSDLRAKLVEEAVRHREEAMRGWLPFEEENDREAARAPVKRQKRALAAQFFLLFSIVFFLLAVDLSPIPWVGALQHQLRRAVRYVWFQANGFFREALPRSHDARPNLSSEKSSGQ
ncbi:MAG: zf-HC2 domain-containing protein [Candidatus Sumerlaeaceae bacterium]|nr:zf-HC2 domain-containing protein [Candidatus Sumerlaeaceae bacterium]